jgi:hypothetical protein
MKALIFKGQIVDVVANEFPVAEELTWVDCPDNCVANIWTYSNGVCTSPPTVKWQIGQMNCYPQAEGQTDVVFQVAWICLGCQQNYCASVSGITSITYQAGSPYTPYNQLTQDQVLGWVWSAGVNKAAVEAELNAKIAALINPTVVAPPLPWG